MTVARFQTGDVAIDVRGNPGSLLWLAEFLAPAFENGLPRERPADHDVELECDTAQRARLRDQLAAAPGHQVEGFTEDGSFTRHGSWLDEDGVRWVLDDRREIFLGVDAGAHRIRVVAGGGPADAFDARMLVMRVARELGTQAALRRGCLPVHASAFLHRGTAMVVCGPRRSGKTTLLVQALSAGATFLSNDRVLVDVDSSCVRAMPTIVMLRDGTVERFPELARAFEAKRFDRARTIAECAPGIDRPEPLTVAGADRPGISPAQLCNLLGAPMVGRARLGAVLFPRIDAGASGIEVDPLPLEAAWAAMRRSILAPGDRVRTSPLFAAQLSAAYDEAVLCRHVVERTPAYACRLGPDADAVDLDEVLPCEPPGQPRRC